MRRATDQFDTHISHPVEKCSWFHWTVKTDELTLTHLILVPWIIQVGVLFSSWGIVQGRSNGGISVYVPSQNQAKQTFYGVTMTSARITYWETQWVLKFYTSPKILYLPKQISGYAPGIVKNSKNIDHLKEVLNSCWDMIIEELINDAVAKYFCHEWHWKCRHLCVFWVVHFPGARQRIFNSTVQTLPVLVLSNNFWTFCENRVTTIRGRKVTMH